MNSKIVPAISISACTLLTLFLAWRHFAGNNSLEEVAHQDASCKRNSDAGCLMKYLGEEERIGYGINEEKLSKFLKAYVEPVFNEFWKSKPLEEITPLKDQGYLVLEQKWTRPGKCSIALTTLMAGTNDGAIDPHMISNLIVNVMDAKYRRASDEHRLLTQIRGFRKDQKLLESLGINGFYDQRSRQVTVWTQLREQYIEKGRTNLLFDKKAELE